MVLTTLLAAPSLARQPRPASGGAHALRRQPRRNGALQIAALIDDVRSVAAAYNTAPADSGPASTPDADSVEKQVLLEDDLPRSSGGCGCSGAESGEAQAQALLRELESRFSTGLPTGPITREDLQDAMRAGPNLPEAQGAEVFHNISDLLKDAPPDFVFDDCPDMLTKGFLV